jgi:hypothetical protein
MPRRPAEPSASRRERAKRAPRLQDLANVGPATLADLHALRIRTVAQLASRDAIVLYESLCERTRTRHDPCVIDVFMAIIHQAKGGKPTPWWKFTARRKRILKQQMEA